MMTKSGFLRAWSKDRRQFERQTRSLGPPLPPNTLSPPKRQFCEQCGRRVTWRLACSTCNREPAQCTCLPVDYTLSSPVINTSPVEKSGVEGSK
jgi:ribosomal protein L44E